MNLTDKFDSNRNAYQSLPDGKRKPFTLWIKTFVVYIICCIIFGFSCYYWTYLNPGDEEELGRLQQLRLGVAPPPSLSYPLSHAFSPRSLPDGFLVGCASSSYQIEGGWNEDGKGENIWDHLVHSPDNPVLNNETGDVACDSYHKYKEDVQLIKDIGFNHYRFSLSWSRILPTGHDDVINRAGLNYYHRLIDELIAHGIEPMITLYHWDLPQPLQELGGWTNPMLADYFEIYARLVFSEYAYKVKWWITLNEPTNVIRGYACPDTQNYAPCVKLAGIADYLAAHNMLRAHARVYHLYDKDFRPKHGGKIFITLVAQARIPKTESEADKMAAQRDLIFSVGTFAHPIFSSMGDYPPLLREWVDRLSKQEGRTLSRLPTFTPQEISDIRGTSDLFGMNHYSTALVEAGGTGEVQSLLRDANLTESFDPRWPSGKSEWLKVVPEGFRFMLNHIRTEYNNPDILITENGFSSDSYIDDYDRIKYYHDYLEQMLLAMSEDGCRVIGYTAWSILDNFEWSRGYTERFGLHYVNFSDPSRPRARRKSGDYFKKFVETRELPEILNNTSVENSCNTTCEPSETDYFYEIV